MKFQEWFSGACVRQWRGRALRWSPLLVFASYVLVTVVIKDRDSRRDQVVRPIRAEAPANCEKICDRMAICALAQFGQTAANEALVPQLKNNCYSGCLLQEEKISGCFQQEMDCYALTECAVQYLYRRQ